MGRRQRTEAPRARARRQRRRDAVAAALGVALSINACAPSISREPGEPIGPPALSGPPPPVRPAPLAGIMTRAPHGPRALPPAFRRAWRPEWSRFVARAIERHSPELLRTSRLPVAEIAQLCPGFARATADDRKAFWAVVFAGISRYESTFNPRASAVEPFVDPETHQAEISEGLLQLSYSDRLNHPDCKADRASRNLMDPEVNLGCGVAIMRQQIQHRQTLFPDHFYYWSVLTRPKLVRHVKSWLKRALAREPYC